MNIMHILFALDPILKDRPNVTPWFTNEEDEITQKITKQESSTSVFLSSDDEFDDSTTNVTTNEMEKDSNIKIIEPTSDNTKDCSTVDEYDNLSIESHHTI